MRYYPICLNITNKRCLIAGGGEVGERKAKRLLECGAEVAVISRKLTPALERMNNEGRIEHIDADYDAAYIEGAFMVIGATDLDEVNKRISEDANGRGILVNIADDPRRCDFILPSLLRRGDLTIALSTGGKSPALARKLREELEVAIGPEYAVFLDIMGELREQVISHGCPSEENKRVFETLVNSDVLQKIKENNWEGVKKRIRDITGLDVQVTVRNGDKGRG